MKFVTTGVGLALGLGGAIGLERTFVGHERASELREDGVKLYDSRQLQTYGFGMGFGAAAGVALGLPKRSPTAGFTTGQQVIGAALLSTAAGAVIDANTDRASDRVLGTVAVSGAVGAGALLGLRDEVPTALARHSGLVAFGVATGMALPIVWSAVRGAPDRLQNGMAGRAGSP